jgi:hypothetical protein
MLTYDEDGLPAARAWLARSGLGDSSRFRDLVAAALHAIPRTRTKDGFARPEARILDALRATLFDDIPAPIDESAAQAPAQLSFDSHSDELGDEEDD